MASLEQKIDVDMVKTAGPMLTVTVRCRRVREYCLRLWLGGVLLRLAAWIMNCNIQIEPPASPCE